MATPVDLDMTGWFRQDSSPILNDNSQAVKLNGGIKP